jgi:hypothetical protein
MSNYLDPHDPRAERRSAGVILDDAQARTGWNDATVVMLLLEYIERQGDNPTFADYIGELVDAEEDL